MENKTLHKLWVKPQAARRRRKRKRRIVYDCANVSYTAPARRGVCAQTSCGLSSPIHCRRFSFSPAHSCCCFCCFCWCVNGLHKPTTGHKFLNEHLTLIFTVNKVNNNFALYFTHLSFLYSHVTALFLLILFFLVFLFLTFAVMAPVMI